MTDARSAVAVGLYASAVRCLLTYVVVPGLGVTGVLGSGLGAAGIVLQAAGAVTSAAGAVRLRRLGHRTWPLYAGLAVVVGLTALWSLAGGLPGADETPDVR